MNFVRRFVSGVIAAVGILSGVPSSAANFPPVTGSGGAVASSEAAATDVGLAVLRQGGNAVDAAVATALALAVVHPEAGNLGGGGFAVVRMEEELATLDFRETAPRAARREMYLDDEGEPRPGASQLGPLAAGVPGSPAGLHELHRRFGSLPWEDVVAPAVRLADQGFAVSARTHRSLVANREKLARFPETAAVWLPDGDVPPAGETLRLPELAKTLRAYAADGPRAITEGSVAAAIERVSRRHGGVLTAADLASYRPAWREPVRFRALGWEFASMGLPSSGGIILGQSLAMLERLEWREQPRFGADRAHLLTEVLRRSFADRFLLGDPETTAAEAAELLDPDWLSQRLASIDPARATSSEDIQPRGEAVHEAAATTHLSVADADGNLVAMTTTLNGLFGCKLYVPEAGFFLNNEMDDFTTAPGRPNMFGLLQGEANTVAPGKRMLSSMSPTLAWKGREAIALGGRGGSRIPTAVLQTFLAFAVDGDDLQAAIARPRIHHQWLPDEIRAEPDALAPETRSRLTAIGHALRPTTGNAKVNAVRITPEGTYEAAADPRGPAVAGVVEPVP